VHIDILASPGGSVDSGTFDDGKFRAHIYRAVQRVDVALFDVHVMRKRTGTSVLFDKG
jgi:hypothetical protein